MHEMLLFFLVQMIHECLQNKFDVEYPIEMTLCLETTTELLLIFFVQVIIFSYFKIKISIIGLKFA